jgi:hypothetical protein
MQSGPTGSTLRARSPGLCSGTSSPFILKHNDRPAEPAVFQTDAFGGISLLGTFGETHGILVSLASENAPSSHSLGPGLAAGVDEDVSGKFEAGTEFANLIQSELALTGKKHGDGTFRTEFRD